MKTMQNADADLIVIPSSRSESAKLYTYIGFIFDI